MIVAVVNAGASTVKVALMETAAGDVRELRRVQREWDPRADVERVLAEALDALEVTPDAIGHRVVHGGDRFRAPATITVEVEAALEDLIPLAPLHNAPAVEAIRAARRRFPRLPAVAVFDTGFHAALPPAARCYALPAELVEAHAIRRYGFHGIAHASLVEALAAEQGASATAVTAVTLQLGAGCSACAVRAGVSIETSMGYTPLEGLVMATRCGDVDPAIVLRLLRAGYDADRIDDQLSRRSGLLALAGTADMRRIIAAAARDEPAAELALAVFCHRIVLTVGAYLTLLEGDGALVFGGGVGTHAPEVRRRVADGLRAWNVTLDPMRNERNEPGRISVDGAREVYALATDEEAVIARAVAVHLA